MAGVIANAAGFATAQFPGDLAPAATWVYVGAAIVAGAAVPASLRLRQISRSLPR